MRGGRGNGARGGRSNQRIRWYRSTGRSTPARVPRGGKLGAVAGAVGSQRRDSKGRFA